MRRPGPGLGLEPRSRDGVRRGNGGGRGGTWNFPKVAERARDLAGDAWNAVNGHSRCNQAPGWRKEKHVDFRRSIGTANGESHTNML